jgi:hypothetical protein
VTKAIKAAIRRLGTHDAALGFHLGATIKTGVLCVYTPDPGRRIRWVAEDRSTGSGGEDCARAIQSRGRPASGP